MKNKLISLLLVVLLVFSTLAVLVSCGGGEPDNTQNTGNTDNNQGNSGNTDTGNNGNNTPPPAVTECSKSADGKHVDANSDGTCDLCNAFISTQSGEQDEDWWKNILYDTTNLIFELTKNSNGEELPSGCEKYMAGESLGTSDLDNLIASRNTDAAFDTKTTITYRYCDEGDSAYGWSKNINRIYSAVSNKTSDTPDMFCNFLTDMLCTSLLGSFANLYSRNRGDGQDASRHDNFMANGLGEEGYMRDLMSSLTLSLNKIYVVASDYFIDLIRAFFIVPVNRALYDALVQNDTADTLISDLDGDGKKDINDFFVQVQNGDWTYETLAKYCAVAYSNTSGETEANLGDRIGFALASDSGLSAAGMVYTSSVVIIHKEWVSDKQDYNYYYPTSNQELLNLTAALKTLFESTGVISVSKAQSQGYGNTSLQSIRNRFADESNNCVLFGGVILLGSLEYEQYQNMKGEGKGFGIVPVPLYQKYRTVLSDEEAADGYTIQDGFVVDAQGNKKQDDYLTQIHVVGRAGGIAHCTSKFTQCTAFLQYQSTHSTDILNRYYNYYLMFNVNDTSIGGNMIMLKLLRQKVRTSFDKLFEDAVGFFYESTDETAPSSRWHAILASNQYYQGDPFRRTDMAQIYSQLQPTKQTHLQQLVGEYNKLPD